MGWRDIVNNFLAPPQITKEIRGQMVVFRPMRGTTLTRLKPHLQAAGEALTALFSDKSLDSRRKFVNVDDSQEGVKQGVTEIDPVSVDMARMRHEERVKAVRDLVDLFLSEQKLIVLYQVIADCWRDGFADGANTPIAELQDFGEQLDVELLVQFMIGVVEVHAGRLKANPLVRDLRNQATRKVREVLQADAEASDESEEDSTSGERSTGDSSGSPTPTPSLASATPAGS